MSQKPLQQSEFERRLVPDRSSIALRPGRSSGCSNPSSVLQALPWPAQVGDPLELLELELEVLAPHTMLLPAVKAQSILQQSAEEEHAVPSGTHHPEVCTQMPP